MQPTRRRRRSASALVAVGVVLSLATLGATQDANAQPCSGLTRTGPVTRIAMPHQMMPKTYAVDPYDPARMFASDGQDIERSLDGGCSWTDVYSTGGTVPHEVPTVGAVPYLDTVAQVVVPGATGGRRNGIVYASISPCLAGKVVAAAPGCQMLVSNDNGVHWRLSGTGVSPVPDAAPGFPADVEAIDAIAASAAAPSQVYLLVELSTGARALYASTDTGQSWTQVSTTSLPPLGVDPETPGSVWTGASNGLMHSVDGGRTWTHVAISSGASRIDIAHPHGRPATITVSYLDGGMLQSRNNGATFAPLAGPPAGVTSIGHSTTAGDLVVTTETSGSAAGAPYLFSGGTWSRIPDLFREELASGSSVTPERFYLADPNSPPSIVVYTPPRDGVGATGPDNIQGAGALGPTSGDPRSCYRGPGVEQTPDQATTTPEWAPAGEGPILVDNFTSGCLVAFDRFGHSKVVMQAPAWSEGVTLTFDKQLVITTRFSSELTVTQLPGAVYSVLDANIQNVEGPTFDRHGNLFVEDNQSNVVFEYPYPQYPGEPRQAVWSFGASHFLEDVKVAPPQSPFAGDLFVQYYSGSTSTSDRNPDAIAVLEPTRHGWRRIADFAHLPPKIASAGLAFMPDGSLLVPDYHGSGVILRYSPDGKTVTPFATVGAQSEQDGVYSFAKIDVTASGYVYVSAIVNGGAACGPDAEPQDGLPVKCDYMVGTRNAIVRFDPLGRRMLPDFTENITGPVGIAVPNVITGLPQILPPVPPVPPTGLVVAGSHPLPPLHQPVPGSATAPAPGPAPVPGAAPGVAPAAQAQAQGNPVGQAQPVAQLAAVTQQETRVQVAVAQADRTEAVSAENSMTALRPRRGGRSGAPVFGALLAGSVVLLGCSTVMRNRSRPQLARATAPDVRGAPRRRRPNERAAGRSRARR